MSVPELVISWSSRHRLWEVRRGGVLVAQAGDLDLLRRHYPDARDETT